MSRNVHQALEYCNMCPKLCRSLCPVSNAEDNEATTPWGKMSAMALLEKGELSWVRPTTDLAYKCTQCRQCTEVCEHDIPVAEVLNRYRVQSFERGSSPPSVYDYCKKFLKKNNPFERDLLSDVSRGFSEDLLGKTRTVYFPGCSEIRWNKGVIHDLFSLFNKLGCKEAGLYPEPIQCCGYPLYAAGDLKGFRDLAEVNFHVMKNYQTILVGSPTCYYTLKFLYEEQGFRLGSHFVPLLDFLKSQVEEHNYSLKKNFRTDIVLHEACFHRSYEEGDSKASEIIQLVAGLEPVIFSGHRGMSACCGAGGLLPVTSPDTSREVVFKQMRESKPLDLQKKWLVTTSSACAHHLKKYATSEKITPIVSYLNSCIE